MASTAQVRNPSSSSSFSSSSSPSPSRLGPRRERWLSLRDLLGGALLLAAWIALWTVTWAAVAGPLSPVARGDAARAAIVTSL